MTTRTEWCLTTFNMGGRATSDDVVELVKLAQRHYPDHWVLSCQETGDQRSELARAAKLTDTELVMGPDGLGRAKLAQLVPAGSLISQGLHKLTPRTFVGNPGAGGPYTDHKYVSWARVGDSAGSSVAVGNVHLMSSVQGRPTPWRPRRRRLHRAQVMGSIRWAQQHLRPDHHHATFLTGDFNATPDSPFLAPYRHQPGWRIEGTGSHGGPNKDGRAIDLLVIPNRSTRVLNVTGLRTAHSDHRPVMYEVSIVD